MGEIRKRIIVKGIVQGVGFRFFARRQAERLGIRGFVANQSDGSVLVEAEGSAAQVRDFIGRLKEGPSAGLVEDIQTEALTVRGETSFSIQA